MSRLDDMGILYLHILEDMNPHENIIAGTFLNDDSDIMFTEFLHGDDVKGKRLRYIAKRGEIHDWAIYVDLEKFPDHKILNNGQKVYDLNVVKQLVKCDDKALEMYRK